jgi:DNA-binding SARP family transcriptional activator
MEFRILGPLEVVDAGQPVPLGGSKQRTLLALLLLTPNRPVSVDRLIDAVWSGEPPAAASNALQYHVAQLRKLLGDAVVVTQEPGYLIRLDSGQLDLLRFEELVGEASGPSRPKRAGCSAKRSSSGVASPWPSSPTTRSRSRRRSGSRPHAS